MREEVMLVVARLLLMGNSGRKKKLGVRTSQRRHKHVAAATLYKRVVATSPQFGPPFLRPSDYMFCRHHISASIFSQLVSWLTIVAINSVWGSGHLLNHRKTWQDDL